jgi:hypothetical protein
MGRIDTCGRRIGGDRLALYGVAGHHACLGLLHTDYRNHVAERHGGGFGRGLRRRWQPDGLWAARRDHISVARNHLVRDFFHDDFDGAFGEARRPECWRDRLDFGANYRSGAGKHDAGHGKTGRACSGKDGACGACETGSNRAFGFSEAGVRYTCAQIAASVTICSAIPRPGGSGGTGRRTSLRGWR